MSNYFQRAKNLHLRTVSGFGLEWSKYNQKNLTKQDLEKIFSDYFSIFPWQRLSRSSVGADIGCGSGRWAGLVAPRVGILHLVDASNQALNIARKNLEQISNVQFHHASVDTLPFEDSSLDFAYSLGVLHHVPDTAGAIRDIARKLKPGGPLLLYLYYRFDNRSSYYRVLWIISDCLRRLISCFPFSIRHAVSLVLAAAIYFPFARIAKGLAACRILPTEWPLAYYRDKPFYVMKNDALDRFGTPLEQRFTRNEIELMLKGAGFINIQFSNCAPYWCGVGFKKS